MRFLIMAVIGMLLCTGADAEIQFQEFLDSENATTKTRFYYEDGAEKAQQTLRMDGSVVATHGDVPEGVAIWRYADGTIRAEVRNQNGKLHGPADTFYPNGNPQTHANYQEGILDGRYLIYHDNGQLSMEATFQQGRQHGWQKRYYDNGCLLSETFFVEGLKHGLMTMYFKDGKIAYQCMYAYGRQQGRVDFDTDGKIIAQTGDPVDPAWVPGTEPEPSQALNNLPSAAPQPSKYQTSFRSKWKNRVARMSAPKTPDNDDTDAGESPEPDDVEVDVPEATAEEVPPDPEAECEDAIALPSVDRQPTNYRGTSRIPKTQSSNQEWIARTQRDAKWGLFVQTTIVSEPMSDWIDLEEDLIGVEGYVYYDNGRTIRAEPMHRYYQTKVWLEFYRGKHFTIKTGVNFESIHQVLGVDQMGYEKKDVMDEVLLDYFAPFIGANLRLHDNRVASIYLLAEIGAPNGFVYPMPLNYKYLGLGREAVNVWGVEIRYGIGFSLAISNTLVFGLEGAFQNTFLRMGEDYYMQYLEQDIQIFTPMLNFSLGLRF